MADQRDEMFRLNNEIVQLKNINSENKAQQAIHPATVQTSSSEPTIKLTKQFSSIFKAIFFDELNRQLPIEEITGLVILEKHQKQQQFCIDEVVKKIIKQQKAPQLAILRIIANNCRQ
uniref:Uncharacterized protein n=1 Tax=Globodera rostochiensis TaxID=31243 RepID=A0A914IG09_GLORO